VDKDLEVAAIRREYTLRGLRKSDLDPDPMKQFANWFADALASQPVEANAMTLATTTVHGRPSARTVLLKGINERGFLFFTNYASRKGRELAENPHAALCFFWAGIERQICATVRWRKFRARSRKRISTRDRWVLNLEPGLRRRAIS
jgi:pyridoxamine 5'-phosphate oxidase